MARVLSEAKKSNKKGIKPSKDEAFSAAVAQVRKLAANIKKIKAKGQKDAI